MWLLSEMMLIGLADSANLYDLIGRIVVGVADKSNLFCHTECLTYPFY